MDYRTSKTTGTEFGAKLRDAFRLMIGNHAPDLSRGCNEVTDGLGQT